jgi:hypothetical protein
MKNPLKTLFKVRRYKTDSRIKQEFVDFLKWSAIKHRDSIKNLIVGSTEEEYNKMVDSYFEEKDIALTGDIRKMHGTNTRNATTDIVLALSMILLSVILMLIFIHFFGDSFQNWMKK